MGIGLQPTASASITVGHNQRRPKHENHQKRSLDRSHRTLTDCFSSLSPLPVRERTFPYHIAVLSPKSFISSENWSYGYHPY